MALPIRERSVTDLSFASVSPNIFAPEIEHPLDMTVQRLHRPDLPSSSDLSRHQHQELDCDLSLRRVRFLFRQAGSLVCGVPYQQQTEKDHAEGVLPR